MPCAPRNYPEDGASGGPGLVLVRRIANRRPDAGHPGADPRCSLPRGPWRAAAGVHGQQPGGRVPTSAKSWQPSRAEARRSTRVTMRAVDDRLVTSVDEGVLHTSYKAAIPAVVEMGNPPLTGAGIGPPPESLQVHAAYTLNISRRVGVVFRGYETSGL